MITGYESILKPQECITISINFSLMKYGLAGKALLLAGGWVLLHKSLILLWDQWANWDMLLLW